MTSTGQSTCFAASKHCGTETESQKIHFAFDSTIRMSRVSVGKKNRENREFLLKGL
jgi:hypothetical protein